MYYWINYGNIHIYISIHALLVNFGLTVVKVGDGVDQGLATEVTHLG